MAVIRKSKILPYSAEQMFSLVDDIESYPKFLPFCSDATTRRDMENKIISATLTADVLGFTKSFSTRNINDKPNSITMTLTEGPLKKLNGKWLFKSLGNNKCEVSLEVDYAISGSFFSFVFERGVEKVADDMVDAFYKRAQMIYG